MIWTGELHVLEALEAHRQLVERAQEIAQIMLEVHVPGKKWQPWFTIDFDTPENGDALTAQNTHIYASYDYGHNDRESMVIPLDYFWLSTDQIIEREQAAIAERKRLAEAKKAAEAAEREAKKEAADRAMYEKLQQRFGRYNDD
jgi:mRNA deadenylase 3'-5' endonuclease subunit Ccr4